uniref:Uncharacterized protein n=1 Tax=Panagrolaimus davidi TaxID=227884 RepID=A0A914PQE9_9BILA
MESLDNLSSDEEIYEQNGDHVKFVRNGEIELELKYNQLEFKFCSDGCMGKTVIACYNSSMPNHYLKGICDPGQCEFRAAVEESYGTSFMWFNARPFNRFLDKDKDICSTAIIKIPEVIPDGFKIYVTCNPLKHDGNVVKLRVRGATYGCPLYVLNAKKWTPPTTTVSELNGTTVPNQTTSKSSEANTTLWIVIGVGIIILLIIVIGFGYCCYRTQIQKKPLFGNEKDVQRKENIPEASNKAKAAENKKESGAKPEPTKEGTVAKEKQPKPAKKKIPKEKKAPFVATKPSKEVTQENVTKEDFLPAKKVSVESTLEAPTTETVLQKSVVQQKQLGNPPRVFVPKKVILPAPKSVNAPKNKSHSSKKDSLSGRHEIGMQIMVVSSLDSLSGAENDETQNSTHASEKLHKKESAGGRKKGSKKHR